MNNTLYKIAAVILAIGVSFAYGRYSAPKTVETKEVVKKETEYITRTIKQSDGTVISEVINRDLVERAKDKTTVFLKPQYKINILPQYNFNTKEVTYGASVEKRISGPIFAGIYLSSDKNIGVSIGIEL